MEQVAQIYRSNGEEYLGEYLMFFDENTFQDMLSAIYKQGTSSVIYSDTM